MRNGWVFEERDDSDEWRTIHGYKTEAGALNAIRPVNNSQPFRVVFRDANGTTIHATRN